MTAALAERRRGRAAWIVAAAVILTLLTWIVSALDANRLKPPEAQGPVLPNFTETVNQASLITIATKDATYRIARTQKGWALRDRGDYPVRRERLAQFTEGLAGLQYVRPMTRDPGKFDRLGVSDPGEGGEGVLVQVQNPQGALLANVILGIEPRGLYARDPTEQQTWAVKGELPPLKDPAAWLDLAPLAIDKMRIANVLIYPPAGPPFAVVRESPQTRDFKLAAPFDKWIVLTPAGVNAAGESFATLQPLDVAPAPSIGGAPRGRVTMRTFDGLVIEGELMEESGRRWVKLVARAETPETMAEAQAINARAAAWAYGLSELDYTDFAPPIAMLARSPVATPPAPAAPPAPAPTAAPTP